MKRHLRALTVPVSWPVEKKGQKFVLRPSPGKNFEFSIPLALVLKNMLKYCKTMGEIKATLLDKEINVDGKRRTGPKYLVGIMDTLSISVAGENYRMLIKSSGKLKLEKIDAEEAGIKPCKVTGKVTLGKNKTQLNLFDGRNIITKDAKVSIGDTVMIKLPGQEIKEVLKFEKGNYALMIGGKHVGEHGKIEHIKESMVTIRTTESEFLTPKEFVYVIGNEKPAIKLE